MFITVLIKLDFRFIIVKLCEHYYYVIRKSNFENINSSNNPNSLLISENSIPIVEMLDNCPSEFSDFAKRSCIDDIYTRETMGAFLRQMGILYNTQHPGWMPELEIWIKAVEQSIDATSKLYQLQKILNISSKPEWPHQLKSGDNYYSSLFISHTI